MKERRGVYILHMILITVLLFSTVSYVLGNSGPQITRPSDEKLIFDEESGVALKEEWVTIHMSTVEEGTVEVRYLLENLHRDEKGLDMLFILPSESGAMEVFWNGDPVEQIEEVPYEDLPRNWKESTVQRVSDPFSGRELMREFYNHGAYSGYKGKKYTVDLPRGETGELTLTYANDSGYFRRNHVVNPVYHTTYYLTPALFWEGDAKAHLEFRLPPGRYAFHSNIPMENDEPGVYRSTLEELPEEEWVISYVSRTRLLFGTNERRIHNTFVGALIIVIFILSLYLTQKKDARFIWMLLLIIPAFFLFSMGYEGVIVMMMLIPIVAVLLLWGLVHLYLKLKDRLGASGH